MNYKFRAWSMVYGVVSVALCTGITAAGCGLTLSNVQEPAFPVPTEPALVLAIRAEEPAINVVGLRSDGRDCIDTPMKPEVFVEEPPAYVGEFTITAYCPGTCCNGSWAGQTATGVPAGPGVVAVDPDVIPLGSVVAIDGVEYLAADTGSAIKGRKIDVCMSTHAEACAFGVLEKEVWLSNE